MSTWENAMSKSTGYDGRGDPAGSPAVNDYVFFSQKVLNW